MNKHREMSRLRILALVLLVLLLTGCLGNNAKATTAPPATATASQQGGGAVATEVFGANTTQSQQEASATPEPAQAASPTKASLPKAATPAPSATSTQAAAPSAAAASAQTGDFYEPIPGCPPSQVHWGDVVRIAPEIEYVRIRSTADTHPADNIVRKLYRSELAQTIGNPVCNYGWVLWPIRTADGTKGWVPETDGVDYWLVKARSWAFPTATPQSR